MIDTETEEATQPVALDVRQYLGWDGESGEDFHVCTVDDLKRNFEEGYYSGVYAYLEFALIEPNAPFSAMPRLTKVKVTQKGERESEDDRIHFRYVVVVDEPGAAPLEIEEFAITIDGRA